MILVALTLLYLAISRKLEPLLLVPIGFGGLLSNIPGVDIAVSQGVLHQFHVMGIETGIFPLVIFMGVSAMTDFGPLLANPKTLWLSAAAQFGIFATLLGATFAGHTIARDGRVLSRYRHRGADGETNEGAFGPENQPP
jgi:oxaloacetate decarboxylase beta subunit